MLKVLMPVLVVAVSALANPAFANDQEDNKWVVECVKDNQDEGKDVKAITTYCVCMNDQMPEDEERSITEWEKSHPKEQAKCDKEAGWE